MNILYFRKASTGRRAIDEAPTRFEEYVVFTDDSDATEHVVPGFVLHETYEVEPHDHEHHLPTDRVLAPR